MSAFAPLWGRPAIKRSGSLRGEPELSLRVERAARSKRSSAQRFSRALPYEVKRRRPRPTRMGDTQTGTCMLVPGF